MKTEYVLYAIRKGEEDWQEELITTADVTPEGEGKLEKAKAWAKQQGFDRFRIAKFNPDVPPDFRKVFRK
jgi:hypothetical protein